MTTDASPISNRPVRWTIATLVPGQRSAISSAIRRICRSDGWIARPTSQPEQTLLDLAEIDRELARQGTSRAAKGFVAAHERPIGFVAASLAPPSLEITSLEESAPPLASVCASGSPSPPLDEQRTRTSARAKASLRTMRSR